MMGAVTRVYAVAMTNRYWLTEKKIEWLDTVSVARVVYIAKLTQ
jgi:hypothetical protein